MNNITKNHKAANTITRGYKVFDSDGTCSEGIQCEVGKTYEIETELKICHTGFHFCKKAIDCFRLYGFDPDNKVAEVEALGNVDTDDEKIYTNKIRIVRELTWHEMLDLANIGKNCTGCGNTGDYNTGNYNTGNYNSGYRNSGDYNSGYCNSGDNNSGDSNSGCYNSGHCNSDDCNSGEYNSGTYNSGNRNSGSNNSGHYNSGDRNSGNNNSGFYNSGSHNSGSYNIGDFNTGDFNKSSYSVGCFNTKERPMFFFDKPTDMTRNEWRHSDAFALLTKVGEDLKPTDWISFDNMSDEEKENHPESRTTGGYLKNRNNSDCFIKWWNELSDEEKSIIKAIPNFDADIFKEITGITVD